MTYANVSSANVFWTFDMNSEGGFKVTSLRRCTRGDWRSLGLSILDRYKSLISPLLKFLLVSRKEGVRQEDQLFFSKRQNKFECVI